VCVRACVRACVCVKLFRTLCEQLHPFGMNSNCFICAYDNKEQLIQCNSKSAHFENTGCVSMK